MILFLITKKWQKDNAFNFLKVKLNKIELWKMDSDFLLHIMSVTFLKCDMKSLKKWQMRHTLKRLETYAQEQISCTMFLLWLIISDEMRVNRAIDEID